MSGGFPLYVGKPGIPKQIEALHFGLAADPLGRGIEESLAVPCRRWMRKIAANLKISTSDILV